MTDSIPITYKNDTGASDFQVLVFTKNFSTNTPKTFYVAWEVLNAQMNTRFAYQDLFLAKVQVSYSL